MKERRLKTRIVLPRTPNNAPVVMRLWNDGSVTVRGVKWSGLLLGKLAKSGAGNQRVWWFTLVGRDGSYREWMVRSDNRKRGAERVVVLRTLCDVPEGWRIAA